MYVLCPVLSCFITFIVNIFATSMLMYLLLKKLQLSPSNKLQQSVFFPLFNRAYSIITNKDDLYKENARTRRVLKKNRYQEKTTSKIFNRNTNSYSLSQSHQ